MTSTSVAELKARVLEAEARADYYESCLNAFFTGDIPNNATLDHMILAQYGRIRIEQIRKTPALLQPTDKQEE